MRKYKTTTGDTYYLFDDNEVADPSWIQVEEDEIGLPDINFVPPVVIPQSISMRQARLILLQHGLLDDIEAAIVAADRATQIEWEYAQEVSRNHPLITQMCAALGLQESEVDNLFLDG